MSGVYTEGKHHCPKCKKETLHDEGWESEFPDKMERTCKECGNYRFD